MKKLLTAALATVIIITSAPAIADAAKDRFLVSNEVELFRQGNAFELYSINKSINNSVYKVKGMAYADGTVSVSYVDEAFNPIDLPEAQAQPVKENEAFSVITDIPEGTEEKVLYAFVTLTLENGVVDTIMLELEGVE